MIGGSVRQAMGGDRSMGDRTASLRSSNSKIRAEVPIILAYVIVWNVDFSIVFGTVGGQIVAIGRWIAILGVVLLVVRDLVSGRDPNSLLPIVALMSLFWPSILFSNDQFYSVVELIRILSLFFIFWLMSERAHLVGSVSTAIGIFSICALIASLPYLSAFSKLSLNGASELAGRFRDVGITTHANNFGFVSNVALSYVLAQSFSSRRRMPWVFRVPVAAIGIVSLILSDSRTAQIELIAISGFFLYFRFFQPSAAISRSSVAVRRTLIAAGILGLISLPAAIVIGDLDTSNLVSNDSFGESNAARLSIWQTAWSEFLDHPLSGVGLGGQIRERYNPIENAYVYAPYAHNAILNILYVAGVGGGLWFVILITRMSSILDSALAFQRETFLRSFDASQIFFLSALIVMTIISAVIEGGLQNNYGLDAFLAISLGSLSAASSRKKSRSREFSMGARRRSSGCSP